MGAFDQSWPVAEAAAAPARKRRGARARASYCAIASDADEAMAAGPGCCNSRGGRAGKLGKAVRSAAVPLPTAPRRCLVSNVFAVRRGCRRAPGFPRASTCEARGGDELALPDGGRRPAAQRSRGPRQRDQVSRWLRKEFPLGYRRRGSQTGRPLGGGGGEHGGDAAKPRRCHHTGERAAERRAK